MNTRFLLNCPLILKGLLLFVLLTTLAILSNDVSHATPSGIHSTSNPGLVIRVNSNSPATQSVVLIYQLPNNGGQRMVCQTLTPNQWSATFPPPHEAPVLTSIDLYYTTPSCTAITNQSPVAIVAIPTISNPPVNSCWFNYTNGILSGCVLPSQTLPIEHF